MMPEYVYVLLAPLLLIVAGVLIAWIWTKPISKRLNLEHRIPKREWVLDGAAVAFPFSIQPILGVRGNMAATVAVLYFLHEGVKGG